MGEIIITLLVGLMIYLPFVFGVLFSLRGKGKASESDRRRASIIVSLGLLCIVLDIAANGFDPLRLFWPLLLVILAASDLRRWRRERP